MRKAPSRECRWVIWLILYVLLRLLEHTCEKAFANINCDRFWGFKEELTEWIIAITQPTL